MSDLKPTGIEVELHGEQRKLLFTLNAIDTVQTEYDSTMIEVLQKMMQPDQEGLAAFRFVLWSLLQDEYEREAFFNPDKKLRKYTLEQAGWLASVETAVDLKFKILEAYQISVPKPDEDADPNAESEPNS